MPTTVNNADGTSSLVFAPGETSWTCPPGFTNALREEIRGPGGGGGAVSGVYGGGGAGGGASARNNNPTYVPGRIYSMSLVATPVGTNGADAWFGATDRLLAKGGAKGSDASLTAGGAGGQGGQASASVGDVRYSGGAGAVGAAASGGGGGGGAGDSGSGSAGGTTTTPIGGAGGTGSSGGAGGKGGNGDNSNTQNGSTPGGGGAGAVAAGVAAGTGGDPRLVITFIPAALTSVTATTSAPESAAATTQDRTAATPATLDVAGQTAMSLLASTATAIETPQAPSTVSVVTTTRQYARIIGYGLSGTAKDYGTGAPIPNCTVKVFREPEDARIAVLTTATDGTWSQGVLQGYTYNVRYIKYGATHADDLTWATPEGNEPVVIVIADNL